MEPSFKVTITVLPRACGQTSPPQADSTQLQLDQVQVVAFARRILKPLLVVSHSTCPPLSSYPHAHRFVLGTAVINIIEGPGHSSSETPKHKTTKKRSPTCDTKIHAIQITTASEIDNYLPISNNPIRTTCQKIGILGMGGGVA